MHKIRKCLLACTILISTVISAATALSLDKKMIDAINDHISNASSRCDFEESTKYYFGKTKFFNYSVVDGKEIVQEQSYDEAMSVFKDAMDACYVTLAKEKQYPRSLK